MSRGIAIGALLAAVLAAVVYAPAARFEFVNYDDPRYVTGDPRVRAGLTPETVRWAFGRQQDNWHPLTTLSHVAVWQVAGGDPAAHHVANVAVHAVNAALVVLALGALGIGAIPATLTALLFALHPLRVESVAWVTERKDVLCGLGFLLTVWAYAAWVRRPSRARGAALLAAFAVGLLGKPMVVTTPLVLLLLDVWPLARTDVPFARRVREKLPLFALAALTGAATIVAQRVGGSMSTLSSLPLGPRLANAVVAQVRYLWATVWPVDLAFFYPYQAWSPLAVAASAAVVGGLCVLTIALAPRRPWLAVGWYWWLVMLLPVSGIFQVGEQAMADRFTYLPCLGLFLGTVVQVQVMVARRPALARVAVGAAVALLVVLTMLTRRQLWTWENSETLARHALAVTRDNHLAHLNLGQALVARGEHAAGRREYEAAGAIAPDYPPILVNLGHAALRDGEIDAAETRFARALALRPAWPDAMNGLGEVAARRGDAPAAIGWFEGALARDPGHWNARASLADVLAATGRADEAISLYEPLLADHPTFGFELGNLRFQRGDVPGALAAWRTALAARPDWHDLRDNVAVALLASGRAAEAIPELERIVAADPTHQRAQFHLGIALKAVGRRPEAARALERAVALRPGDAEAKRALDDVAAGR